jgi:RND superfamily putative drug exporter
MQRAMDKLDGFLKRRRRVVLALWAVLLVVSLPLAARQTEHLTSGGFDIPGSGSELVDSEMSRFPGAQSERLAVVLRRTSGATDAGVRAAIERIAAAAAKRDHVELSPAVKAASLRQVGKPVLIVPLHLTATRDQTANLAVDLRKDLDLAGGPKQGVKSYMVGQSALWAGMQDLSKEDLASAEAVGFPLVLLILLVVFGSLAAAVLPLALGFASVIITGAAIFLLSRSVDMSVFVTNMASMIGIGVAVDYSLFILARYREEIHAGVQPDEARRRAMRTSGLAVAFSGVTVMISLAGLFVVNAQTIRSMALGAIIVVAVSILGALTLLPTLMTLMGRRTYSRDRFASAVAFVLRTWRNMPRRRGSTHPDRAPRGSFWHRWTERVTRRPGLTAAASAAVMLVLAIPALSLVSKDGALRQFPEGNDTRVGAELAAKQTSPGAAGPVQVVVRLREGDVSSPANRDAIAAYTQRLARDPAIATVSRPKASADRRAVLIAAIPKADPESKAAFALVDRVRDNPGPLERIAQLDVGGSTASVHDFNRLVSTSMWKILLFVLAASYIVLLVLLRSVLLPLKAVLMNLLSVGAAYGVLVAVFQWGWFDGFMGFQSLGYINTMTPPLLLAIVFGLSMDYEVFLLSRIRERYEATHDTQRSVAEGLEASAKTITSAALIMVAVFAVFAGTGVPSIKEIGLGLSVAIALDATIVRLVLVPATMELLGDWNWWLPKPLDRLLPDAAFEAAEA